jgi:LPS-assembly protein
MRVPALALVAALLASGGALTEASGNQTPATGAAEAAVKGPATAASAPAATGAARAPAEAASAAASVASVAPSAGLAPSRTLQPTPRGEAARQLPSVLMARRLRGQPDIEAVAEGDVEFRRGPVVMRADRIAYDVADDRARAQGRVRIEVEQAVYSGPELSLQLQRFEGYFLEPEFEFFQLGAGGRADRVDFLGGRRTQAIHASYTSCPRDGPEEPAWVLKADRVALDLDANEGVAEGAVLRFLGAPILALPTLSFPLGDARKSGWLPPSVSLDNRSGLELAVPYYWNIAPNRDATFAPRVMTRRGFGLDAEFRYLEPRHDGELRLDLIPDDRVVGDARGSARWLHESRLPLGVLARVDAARVSDADWWSDFPNRNLSLIPRLLPTRLALERPFGGPQLEGLAYARAAQWQVLQDDESPISAPFQRTPQLGLRLGGQAAWLHWALETEYNRFTVPSHDGSSVPQRDGERAHLLGSVSLPWREPGWWVIPKLGVNAAAYDAASMPGASQGERARAIPTFSVDTGLELERETEAFGRRLRQTLEPRLVYVNTPYKAQSQYPSYDAWAKDFNFVTVYDDNAFSGVDRVADLHQIAAGFTTRLVDAGSGAEALRVGLVQKYLLRPQQIAPQADGSPDGPPLTQRFSDAVLLGSTNVLPSWALGAAVQYSPDIQRTVRSILGARYSPGPQRTASLTYRYSRGLTEQAEVGWQWPLLERTPGAAAAAACQGSWYSVGRFNYSLKDSRFTDTILGVEYDAGCWIGRFVVERLSTGRSEATTRLLFQLELVGLSRLGSNPVKVLKENIPGYQVLREERAP